MGHLMGLKEYLDSAHHRSVFDEALASQKPWELHLHGHRILRTVICENSTYDVKVNTEGIGEETFPKLQIKLLYPAELSGAVRGLVKIEKKVQALGLQPILAPKERHIVKNKTLYPLMKEKQVVFFTLLEGEVVRGVVADFSQYDIVVHLKGGLPAVILRHSIFDCRNKQGRCLLKSFQETHKDWQKSPLFVA